MLPKALLAAALATSTASAFLLPPPAEGKPTDSAHDNSEASGAEALAARPFFADGVRVDVPCPNCPVKMPKHGHMGKGMGMGMGKGMGMGMRIGKGMMGTDKGEAAKEDKAVDAEGEFVTVHDIASNIKVTIQISHDAEHDRLLINDLGLYPTADVHDGLLMATVVPDCPGRKSHHGHHGGHHGDHHDKDKEEEKEKEEKEKEKEEKEEEEEGTEKADDDDSFELMKRVPLPNFRKHPGPHMSEDMPKRPMMMREPVPLGYAVQVNSLGQDASNGMEAVEVALQILQVDGAFVTVPSVNIRLVRTAENGLMIAHIALVEEAGFEGGAPPPPPPPPPHHPEHPGHHEHHPHHDHPPHHHHKGDGAEADRMMALKEELDRCSNMLCRWKTIIASGLRAHGCHKPSRMGGAMATDDSDDAKPPHHHHHHHHDHHGHHGAAGHFRHMHHHSWSHLFKKLASLILLPVLIGLGAGVFVSLVGMVVGTLIVGLWRLVFRRGSTDRAAHRYHHLHHHRHGHHSHHDADAPDADSKSAAARHAAEPAAAEEKAGLMVADLEAAEPESESESDAAVQTPISTDDELPPYMPKDTKTVSA